MLSETTISNGGHPILAGPEPRNGSVVIPAFGVPSAKSSGRATNASTLAMEKMPKNVSRKSVRNEERKEMKKFGEIPRQFNGFDESIGFELDGLEEGSTFRWTIIRKITSG